MPIKRPRYLAEAKKEMNFFVLRPTCRNFAPHFQESSTFRPRCVTITQACKPPRRGGIRDLDP